MRHLNIPVFIPHLGCPHTCVFCNQRSISGQNGFDPQSVRSIIDSHLTTVSSDDEVEIAFFGGSFTGIDRALMTELLSISNEYLKDGRVKSVRCSTRPDYINGEILDILAGNGVRVIELGIQSVSESVLSLSKRGHSRKDIEAAVRMVVEGGFDLVGQMMIGLPGSTPEDELDTARLIISSGASGARIYPTVVFRKTELCSMAETGNYTPLSVEDAVERSAEVLKLFVKAGVPVIRIGLCANENLSSEETFFAGPNHPALGELVITRLYYKLIIEEAASLDLSSDDILYISVARGNLSKAIGQHKTNKNLLIKALGVSSVRFIESDMLTGYGIKLQTETGDKRCI